MKSDGMKSKRSVSCSENDWSTEREIDGERARVRWDEDDVVRTSGVLLVLVLPIYGSTKLADRCMSGNCTAFVNEEVRYAFTVTHAVDCM